MRRCLCDRKGQNVSRTGDRARPGQGLVYQAAMPESAPTFDSRGIARRILPLAAIIVLVGAAYLASGGVSLESLVPHRAAIDDFVLSHRLLAVLSYIVTVAHSVPGAVFLTVTGGFLFGLVLGASAAVINATIGATLIFLAARTALGDRCCGAPVRARTSWPADFARMRSAICFFCASCRRFRSFWSIWRRPRRCAAWAVQRRDRDRYYPGSHRLRSCGGRAGQHDRGAEEFIRSMHRSGGPDCRLMF